MEEQTISPVTEPTEPQKKRTVGALLKKPWVILLATFMVVAGAVGLSINKIMLTVLHSKPEVAVPSLEGKSLMEALNIVSELDLSLRQSGTEFDESLPAGTVLRQHPPSGMRVRAGRTMQVVVSKGGQVAFTPSIGGKPLAEAQSLLTASGMQLGAVTELYSSDIAKGFIVTQSPDPGTLVARGAFVDVEVSKGASPSGLPVVPDFFGKTADQAKEWAGGMGATVKVKEDPKAVGVAGTIVKQEPQAGQPLLEGDELQITIVTPAAPGSRRLNFEVPKEESEVVVRIMARDNQGENQIYQGKHNGGATLEIPLKVKSTTRLRIYLNDVLKEERVVEP